MHIDLPSSALYVIDLKKFRQIAAGDRLRGQYQGLSSDPNSLSNLDQVRFSFHKMPYTEMALRAFPALLVERTVLYLYLYVIFTIAYFLKWIDVWQRENM